MGCTEPNDQPVPVAVAPVKLKKDAKRADRSGRDDEGGPTTTVKYLVSIPAMVTLIRGFRVQTLCRDADIYGFTCLTSELALLGTNRTRDVLSTRQFQPQLSHEPLL